MKKYLLLLLALPSIALSDPAVNSATGPITHGSALTIGGTGFGTKSPAAPLIWDDGESATVDDPAQPVTRGWGEARPTVVQAGSEYAMQYRTTWQSIPQPHAHSSKYLAAGFKASCSGGAEPCNNVQVSKSHPTANGYVYASWRVRYDPLWESVTHDTNDKEWYLRETNASAWNDQDGSYFANAGPPTPFDGETYIHLAGRSILVWPTLDFTNVPNPTKGWCHREVIARYNPAYLSFKTGNVHAANSPQTNAGAMSSSSDLASLGGFTFGGYARAITATGATDDRMRVWLDDLYLDTTFSRVVMGNNADYDSCTIVEPQIPSAWSATSITATVNLGALTGTTFYLFVFDADNNHNATGYPVTAAPASISIGAGNATISIGAGNMTITLQ